MANRTYFLHSPSGATALDDVVVVLWHGAGGDVDHPTIVRTAEVFAESGAYAVRARFPYRVEGRKAPDRMPKLIDSAHRLIDGLAAKVPVERPRWVLGGRSMGGRMTSMLVAEGFEAAGLVLMSYPLHPAGKKDRLRDAHLPDIDCPMLFLQGTKDNMADLALLRPIVKRLGPRATLETFERGDHGMKRVDPDAVAQAALQWAHTALGT